MASGLEFRNAINRWAAKRLPEAAKTILQVAVATLAPKIVYKTPVRTGLARGNHRLAIGSRVARNRITRKDRDGRETIDAMIASASRLAAYSSFTIYNSLPYIDRLENGWSRQAPLGMYRLSMREFKREMPSVLRQVRKLMGSVRYRANV